LVEKLAEPGQIPQQEAKDSTPSPDNFKGKVGDECGSHKKKKEGADVKQ
jgi:hypothetical protein